MIETMLSSMNLVDLIRFIIDIIASVGFTVFAYKFYRLNDAALVSMKEAWWILVLLARYKTMENPEEYIARIGRMSLDDAKLVVEKDRIVEFASEKAVSILAYLRTSVPGSQAILDELEEKEENRQE